MSEQTPDPADKAYLEAEAMLSDDAARAARRARVLAAVADEGAERAAPVRRPLWRRDGWLVAASVAGLAGLLAVGLYWPFGRPVSPPVPAPAAPAGSIAAAPTAPAAPVSARPRARAPVAPIPAASGPGAAKAPPAQSNAPEKAQAFEASPPPPAARAFPGSEAPPPLPPPPPPRAGPGVDAVGGAAQVAEASAPKSPGAAAGNATSAEEMTVTAEKREQRTQSVPRAVSAFTSSRHDVATTGAAPADLGARLRAAAAAGRTKEVEKLLKKGAPVDAADAYGETALMKSIEADHPASVAALRRHGASLDQQNRLGKSARDLAAEKHDPALDKALGRDVSR